MRVCATLGVPFMTMDCEAEYKKEVVDYMIREYSEGRVPNPDVFCNKYVKFGVFLDKALKAGADFIATGHYAMVEIRNKKYELRESKDREKDQSYFLHRLNQTQLSKAMFPLGNILKSEVRRIAEQHGLSNHAKKDSTGICFIGERPFREFLNRYLPTKPGDMVTPEGQTVGKHMGLSFYTIGQRKGLGLTSPNPLYVVELDATNNRVIVGDDTMLDRDEFRVERCNWIPFDEPPVSLEVSAKIRYNHPGTPATITPTPDGGARVKLRIPQRAITPGQACVFYQDDLVVGGGWITRE